MFIIKSQPGVCEITCSIDLIKEHNSIMKIRLDNIEINVEHPVDVRI